MIAAAALALVACGDDDEPVDRAGPPPSQATGDEPATHEASEPTGGEATTETAAEEPERPAGPASGEQAAAPRQCLFEAPEGRLAEAKIQIELTGVDCDQGRRLAKTAALGQPAGANLTLSRDRFSCEPSSHARGDNVSYTCTGPSGEVRFDVVWSAAG